MHDLIQKLLIRAHAAWRWRWYGLLTAWLVCIAIWAAVAFIPNRYSSSAQVEIDTDSMLRPLMQGIAAEVDTESMTRTEILNRTLFSRANVEEVMRMNDLDIWATTPREMELFIASLQARLNIIRNRKDSNIFTLSFTDTNPRLAKDIVQSFLTIFADSNLSQNREDIERTQRFLAGQIREIEEDLANAETELAEFRIEYRDFLPGQGGLQDQLDTLMNELESLYSRRSEEMRVRDQLKVELARLSDKEAPGAPLSPGALRIRELEQELKRLLLKLTEEHPDVINLRRVLAAERAELESASEDPVAATPEIENQQIRLMRLQLAEQNTRIAEIDRRIKLREEQAAKWREDIKRMPQIQAQYAQLQRNYDIIRENQIALLERREAARFAGEIENKSEAVEFRIVSQPNLPITPNAPNRKLLRAGGMAMGIAAGFALPVLLSLAFPTFGSVRELERLTGRPVIAKITAAANLPGRWRRGAGQTLFISLFAGLLALGAVVVSGLPESTLTLIKHYWESLNIKGIVT